MTRFILTLLLTLVALATAAAQTLPQCADNGESSSRRTITPDSGKVLAEVPAHWRERAQRAWSMDYVSKDHPEPATGVHATAARVFRFPRATFYLVTVNGEQGLFSEKCPFERCSEWWTDGTLVANRDHPPAAVPGDEFYLRRSTGQAVLVQADPFGELYELTEKCTLRDLTIATAHPPACEPTATTLCLQDRFELTASTIFQAHVTYAQVGLRSPESGTFWFFNHDAQDVLVRITDTCATDHHYTVRLAGVRTASVTIHDTITDKSVTHDVNGTARITTLPCTMMTKHR